MSDEPRFLGGGIGKFVPTEGEHTFWILRQSLDGAWVPYRIPKCHRIDGPNGYSHHSVALSPYWSGAEDDPQYQAHVIGGEAHEDERSAVITAIAWNRKDIERAEEKLRSMKVDNDKLAARLRDVETAP